MIAVDANILVYAHREDSPFHTAAARRVAELAENAAPWAIPWPCLHEFLAIVTHRRIYAPPTPLARALEQADAWLESPTLMLLAESSAYWPALRPLPAEPFTYGMWKTAKVNIDYHLEIEGHYYSVPHALIHQVVEARVTVATVEIYQRGERIVSHRRGFTRVAAFQKLSVDTTAAVACSPIRPRLFGTARLVSD